MAIAVSTTVGWGHDTLYANSYTSSSFTASAGTQIVVAMYGFDATQLTISNNGAALSWSYSTVYTWMGSASNEALRFATAAVASTRTGLTVTVTSSGSSIGFPSPAAAVYVLTGCSGAVITGNAGSSTSTTVNLPTTAVTSGDTNSWLMVVGIDTGANGSYSSSDGTLMTPGGAGSNVFSVYRGPFASSGSSMQLSMTRGGSTDAFRFNSAEIRASASATTHNADASRSTTSTITPTLAATRAAAAALSTTSAVTATAGVTRFPAAALSTTSALTAAAVRTAVVDAALSTTATLAATMDVIPPAGSVSADVALSTTSAVTATAALTRPLDAALSTTATLTATGVLDRPLAGAVSTALAITATMSIEGEGVSTPGFMRPASMATATMRRPTGAGSVPRIVALVDLDIPTMTALLSTSVTPSALGVPIFQGGSVSPAAAGLIAAGLPYVWFAGDGTIYKETGA